MERLSRKEMYWIINELKRAEQLHLYTARNAESDGFSGNSHRQMAKQINSIITRLHNAMVNQDHNIEIL
jgi:hypothetical protein